jgi:branched-chain amino acid transport system substrate-binding protein
MKLREILLPSLLAFACVAGASAQTPPGKPIRIGFIGEQSGAFSFFGAETTRTMKLAAQQINAAGGLLGRPIEVIDRDSKSTVNDAVRQARELLFTENVDFLMHSISSAECVAVGNVAKQAKKILFSICASDDFLGKDGHEYVFRIPNITTRTQGFAVADYVRDNIKKPGARVYTLANDYAYGRLVTGAFKERMLANDRDAKFIGEAWPKATESDYTAYITAIIEAKPDVLFTALGVGIPFWQQIAPYALTQKVSLVTPVWGGSDELQVLTKEAIPNDAVIGGLAWYSFQSPANDAFVDGFRKTYNKPPQAAAYLQFVSLQGLRAGVEKANSTDSAAVIKALEGLTFDSVLGPVSIRAFDHQGTTPHYLGKAGWDAQRNLGVLTDIKRIATDSYLLSEAEIRKLRP